MIIKYYEMETMSLELREAISMTFDRNRQFTGMTFYDRLSCIFDDELRKKLYNLYAKNRPYEWYWRGNYYTWKWDIKNKVIKLIPIADDHIYVDTDSLKSFAN